MDEDAIRTELRLLVIVLLVCHFLAVLIWCYQVLKEAEDQEASDEEA